VTFASTSASSTPDGGGTPDAAPPARPWRTAYHQAQRARCDQGDGRACWSSGYEMAGTLTAPLGEEELREQTALFRRGCDLGCEMACVWLARQLAQGRGTTRDLDRARALARHACELPEAATKGCTDGYAIVGEGCIVQAQLATDARRVPAILKRACDVGFVGYGRFIYNSWMPGFPVYYGGCDRPRFGKPIKPSRH
jgi:hypothetical protein